MSEDKEPQLIMLPLDAPRPRVTFKQFAWALVQRFAVTIIGVAIAGYVAMLAWNGIVDLTHLPEITWQQAACAFIVLRLFGIGLFGTGRYTR